MQDCAVFLELCETSIRRYLLPRLDPKWQRLHKGVKYVRWEILFEARIRQLIEIESSRRQVGPGMEVLP